MSTMARPRIHTEATGEALLEAAVALLREGGPDRISVRAVAEATGTSSRAVYAVFGSRQALVDAVAERGYQGLATLVDRVPVTDDPVADLVAAGVDGFRAFATAEPEIFRLTFEQVSAEVLARPRVGRAALAAYRALERRVVRAQEAGAVHRARDVETVVFAFHSACQGLASSELAAASPPRGPGFWPMLAGRDLRQVWTTALRALVTGLGSAPGEEV
jgi:AcrR family transcriptional regulator